MQSLRNELKKLAKETGTEIDEEAEAKAMQGHIGSFEIEYTAGNAHGKVTASVTDGKTPPDEARAAGY